MNSSWFMSLSGSITRRFVAQWSDLLFCLLSLVRSVLCPRPATASRFLLCREWHRRVNRQRVGLLVPRGISAGRQRKNLLQCQERQTTVEQLPACLWRWAGLLGKSSRFLASFYNEPTHVHRSSQQLHSVWATPLQWLDKLSFLTFGYAWNPVAACT